MISYNRTRHHFPLPFHQRRSPVSCSIALSLAKQLRQPRDVEGDPWRLVFRQDLRLPGFVLAVAGVQVRECLPVGGRHSRRASGRLARELGCGGMSFGARRARRPVEVGLPPHWRDLQWRSLPRIDPAARCSPTWPVERIRPAATVCYLQRDVFIERIRLNSTHSSPEAAALRLFPVQSDGASICRVGLQSKMAEDYEHPSQASRHRRAVWVLHLDPVPRRARPMRRAQPLRNDTLKAKLAGVLKDQGAVLVRVVAQDDAEPAPAQQPR
jgi:hypothetical protein